MVMKSLYNRMLSGNLGDDIMPYSFKKKNWIPALIGAAAAIGGNLLSNSFASNAQSKSFSQQKELQSDQFWMNKQLMDKQNEINIEQWNRENEYNLPSNQVQRLMDAGINPNNVLGNMGSAMGGNINQTGLGQVSAGSAPSPQWSAIDSGINPMSLSQMMLNKSQENVNQSEADLNKSKTEGQDLTNKTIINESFARIWEAQSRINLNNSTIKLNDIKFKQALYEYNWLQPFMVLHTVADWQHIIQATRKLVQDEHTSKAQEELAIEKKNTEQHAQKAYDASANASNASAAASMSQVPVNQAQARKVNAEADNEERRSAQVEYDAVRAENKTAVAKEFSIDPEDLEPTERVNKSLDQKGFTFKEKMEFWSSAQLGMTTAMERSFKKDAYGNSLKGVNTFNESVDTWSDVVQKMLPWGKGKGNLYQSKGGTYHQSNPKKYTNKKPKK